MTQQRFTEIDPETTRSEYKDKSDTFYDGEDVPMLITEASYDDQRDIYKMTLMEIGEQARVYYASIFLKWNTDSKADAKQPHKAGELNKISLGSIHDLVESLYGIRQWMEGEDIAGGIIGVHFKIDENYPLYPKLRFYRLSESFEGQSHTKYQQIFET